MKTSLKIIASFLAIFCLQLGYAQKIKLENLQVNYMQNPIGLDEVPLFSWQISATKHHVLQESYCIKVYQGTKVIWNSGRINSRETNHIKYAGTPLEASTLYHWEVTVKTNKSKKITAKATFETGLLNSGWSDAQWIQYHNKDSVFTQDKQTDKVVMFRSFFEVNKTVTSAKIYTTSLGVHDLFINGKRVGHVQNGGTTIYDELKPGWTDVRKHVFYLTYDVTQYLNKGKNAVGAYVASGWASGKIAHNRYKNPPLSYKAKLLLTYTDGTSEVVVTNGKDWKTSVEAPIRMADIYAGEDYDARFSSTWTIANFNDVSWLTAKVYHGFQGDIISHIGTPIRVRKDLTRKPQSLVIYDGIQKTNTDYGVINKVHQQENTASFTLKKGQTAILDFGQNLVGWTPIQVKGIRGTKIKLRYAEMLNDSGSKRRGNDGAKGTLYTKNLRKARASVHYTLNGDKNGETYQPSMTWFGFRYVEISADTDIEVKNIHAIVISSVPKESSKMITNNTDVNKLFQNTLWGQRGNFMSVPLDCPQRNERMGWMADTQVFTKTALYNANVISFYQKWMKDVRNGQYEDGAFPTIAPQTWGAVGKGEAAWADAGIIVPYMVYQMSGNTSILEENYHAMTRYMDYLSTQSTQDYLYNGPGTRYGDWLAYTETDKRFISVCFYAYNALLMEQMAAVLHKKEDVEKYKELYNSIKAEFYKRYVTNKGTLSEHTQTAYLYALKLNLFKTAEETKIATLHLIQLLTDNDFKLATGFLGTAILSQTLSELGESDMAYNLLLQRNNPSWLYSIDQGATTIWERWNSYTIKDGFGDARMNSFNHYAYGAIVEWMYAYMAGIKSDGAGFRKIIIEPQLDLRKVLPKNQSQITNVNAQVETVNGMVKSAWSIEGKEVTYHIFIPANTTATFVVPANQQGDIKKQNGILSVTLKNNKRMIELGSGDYEFKMKISN